MTLSLPLPGKKAEVKFYYIPYHLGEGVCNFSGVLKISDTETVETMRQKLLEKYNLKPGSFIVVQVQENYVKKIIDRNSRVEEFETASTNLFYEVKPDLLPKLDSLEKFDDNFGVGDEWTKVVI